MSKKKEQNDLKESSYITLNEEKLNKQKSAGNSDLSTKQPKKKPRRKISTDSENDTSTSVIDNEENKNEKNEENQEEKNQMAGLRDTLRASFDNRRSIDISKISNPDPKDNEKFKKKKTIDEVSAKKNDLSKKENDQKNAKKGDKDEKKNEEQKKGESEIEKKSGKVKNKDEEENSVHPKKLAKAQIEKEPKDYSKQKSEETLEKIQKAKSDKNLKKTEKNEKQDASNKTSLEKKKDKQKSHDQKVEEKILIVENSDAMKKKEEINLSKKDEKKNKTNNKEIPSTSSGLADEKKEKKKEKEAQQKNLSNSKKEIKEEQKKEKNDSKQNDKSKEKPKKHSESEDRIPEEFEKEKNKIYDSNLGKRKSNEQIKKPLPALEESLREGEYIDMNDLYDPNEKKKVELFIEETFNTTFDKISPKENLAQKLEILGETLNKLKQKKPSSSTNKKKDAEKNEEKKTKNNRPNIAGDEETRKNLKKNEKKPPKPTLKSESSSNESENEQKPTNQAKNERKVSHKKKSENNKGKNFQKKKKTSSESSGSSNSDSDSEEKKQIEINSEIKLEEGIPILKGNHILLKVFHESPITAQERENIIKWNLNLKKENQDKIPYYISELTHLLDKASEYKNENIISNIKKASNEYCFRYVKGDGNCSYRSIIFSYLENILFLIKKEDDVVEGNFFKNLLKNLNEIKEFNLSINKNRKNASVKQKIIEEDNGKLLRKYFIFMLIYLIMHRKKCRNESEADFSDFFKNLINENPLLDMGMLGFLRCGIRKYYQDNLKIYRDFILDDISEMIIEIDLEGENSIFKIASDLLQVKITYIEIENQYKVGDPFTPEKINEKLKEIFLYYRHGHYDILYKNSQINRKIPIKNEYNLFEVRENPKNLPAINRNDNKFCNHCKNNKDNCIKSKTCDHAFCVECLFTLMEGSYGDDITCSVCKTQVMKRKDLNDIFN